jgi:acrylyl-CoA reductase (NADPH)/3-hydroxypropionyl-CoA dehydratase/3-hydroxypropionyl-CoA synthetase
MRAMRPSFRWFHGARTNACFNEVDRHVLGGRGAATAIIFEGDRWDPSRNDGRGGPVFEQHVSYRDLLLETVLRARSSRTWACRAATASPSTCRTSSSRSTTRKPPSAWASSTRPCSAASLPRPCRTASTTPAPGRCHRRRRLPQCRGRAYKESYTDQALDNFIPLPAALACLDRVLERFELGAAAGVLRDAVAAGLRGEITIERSDLMRELGAALADKADLSAERTAELRTTVARELAGVQHTVEQVVVVRYTGQDIVIQGRDRWSA